MVQTDDKVILSIESYEALKNVETEQIQSMQEANDDLLKVIESDYSVVHMFLENRYYRKDAGIKQIVDDHKKLLKEITEECEMKLYKSGMQGLVYLGFAVVF